MANAAVRHRALKDFDLKVAVMAERQRAIPSMTSDAAVCRGFAETRQVVNATKVCSQQVEHHVSIPDLARSVAPLTSATIMFISQT
jgi:hypothetical protein